MERGLIRNQQQPLANPQNNFASPAVVIDQSTLVPEGSAILEYYHVILNHRWLILATLVIVVLLTTIFTLRMTPIYEASGKIAINRETAPDVGMKDSESVTVEDFDYNVVLETQVKILQSDAIALQVIKNLQLMKDPAFIGPKLAQKFASEDPLKPLAVDSNLETQLLGRFRGGLKIAVVPRTRIVEIRYSSPDAKLAAKIVNGVATTYIEQNFRAKFESAAQTSDWLSKQLADLQLKVETSEQKLVRYQRENGVLGIDDKQNIITQKLDELNRQLTAAEAERIQKQSVAQMFQSGDAAAVEKVEPSPQLAKLRSQEDDLKVQIAQFGTQFGPNHPKILELNNQLKQCERSIAIEMKRIATRFQNEYATASSREAMLRQAFEQQKQEANRLNESAIDYNLLKREAESNRQLYDGLLRKLKEAGVLAGLKSSNIRIVDLARVPSFPSSPNVPRNIMLSVVIGLLCGIGVAIVRESLDNSLKTPEEAQNISLLPSLGFIPFSALPSTGSSSRSPVPIGVKTLAERRSQWIELVTHVRPRSELAEAYRALRTSVLLSSAGGPPKVILITSALPQEGKSTVSINTAIVLAQKGSRVLLIDADLRRPRIHNALGVPMQPGLSNLLSGAAKLPEIIVQTLVPNLYAIPSGPIAPQPAELLGSVTMRDTITQLCEQFDHIVIDSPPTLAVTDPVLLSVLADAVILVVRAGHTTKAAMRHSRELLVRANANVTGFVMNGLDMTKGRSSYHYYYYGRYYKGNYYSSNNKEVTEEEKNAVQSS